MTNTLPDDATLRDLLATLDNKDAFVSQVFGVAHHASKEHGDIVIRLGVTGTGKVPNYRIEDATSGMPIIAINGANHQPWPEGEEFSAPNNWSRATMTKAQIEELLGEIRNFKRKGPG